MPIYEYEAVDANRSCPHCVKPFEHLQRMSDPPLRQCPKCASPIHRIISAHAVGPSASGLDQRAKAAGFTKLQRLGKGEYERKY